MRINKLSQYRTNEKKRTEFDLIWFDGKTKNSIIFYV